ncbi:DNA replication complex GINS protein psf3, partial [Lachnellula arida]
MSYYDIDAILTDAQKVPCTFELDVPSLGYLDNNPGHALKRGTRVDLPLWLAELLAVSSPSSNKSLVTLDLPPSLSPRVMNALK